jgi:hypothetical protein
VSAPATGMARTYCQFCRKSIFRAKNGDWYHVRNSSVSCYPGSGSDRRALPAARAVRKAGA